MASVQFGNYQILRKIGSGGMAQVFEAQRIGLEGFSRRVALKCILPEMTRDHRFVEMFVNEARLGSQLHHPNIVEIQDFNKVNDVYYIAMEFVEGVDLGEVIRRFRDEERDFPPGLAIDITLQALDGLGYAHEATTDDGAPMNIIHRDIKPSNLLLTVRGTVKIADFGIAKAATNAYQTRTSEVTKGSLAYMSPEQITRESPISPASDLFALGAVLFEMLKLRALFDGENMPSIMFKVAQVEIDRDLSEIERTSPQFVHILKRVLHRDPTQRYRSASEMAADLRAIRSHFPDHPSIQEVAQGMVKPHPVEEEEIGDHTVSMLGLSRGPESVARPNLAEFSQYAHLKPPPAPISSNPQFSTVYLPQPGPVQLPIPEPPVARNVPPPVAPVPVKSSRVPWFIGSMVAVLFVGGLLAAAMGAIDVSSLLGNGASTITLSSDPSGAEVFVNGVRQMGASAGGVPVPVVTPTILKLKGSGKAILMVQKSGYQDGQQELGYRAGEDVSVKIKLEKINEFGGLFVSSNPPGAAIYLDDQPTGRVTPSRLEKQPAGQLFMVRLDLEGFQPATQAVKVLKDDIVNLEVSLVKKAEQKPTGVQGGGSSDSKIDTNSKLKDGRDPGGKVVAKDGGGKDPGGTNQGSGNQSRPEPVQESGPPGTLVANCVPTCYVYIDDMPRRKSPARVELSPGSHSVRLETYDGKDSHTYRVKIEAGREETRVWDWSLRQFLADD